MEGPKDPFDGVDIQYTSLQGMFQILSMRVSPSIIYHPEGTHDSLVLQIKTLDMDGEIGELGLILPRTAREQFLEEIRLAHFLDEPCTHEGGPHDGP